MDKKDAIDYLLHMKHDVQAGSPVDVAIDTAIEALKATVKQPKTNGDRIRNMTDEELAEWLDNVAGCGVCVLNEGKYRYSGDHCAHEYECIPYIEKWLKQEVGEDA